MMVGNDDDGDDGDAGDDDDNMAELMWIHDVGIG